MYISKNKHILSHTIMAVAVFNLIAEFLNAAVRLVLKKTNLLLTPDMLEDGIWKAQRFIFLAQIIATCLVFWWAWRQIKQYRSHFSKEEEDEIMQLQLEYNPKGVSILTMNSIEQLIKIWAAILIGVELVYEVTSIAYKRLISDLLLMIVADNEQTYLAFTSMYNSSHGFKYVGMLIAICMGILTTGVFLRDKTLTISSGILIIAFMAAFLLVENSTLVIASRTIGVVWTSVIFHLLKTVGLFAMAFYMKKRYRGT